MPYDPNDDLIIRNGTLRQLLNYKLRGTPVKSWHISATVTTLVAALAFWLGTLF